MQNKVSEYTENIIKKYSKFGYLLDLFFIEKPIYLIKDEDFFLCFNTALQHINLSIDSVVNKTEFMVKTQSIPVNRYVKLPKKILEKYDDRVNRKNTLDIITYDPTIENKESGIKIEENVQYDSPFFHSPRYISAFLIPYNNYTVIKIGYNWKLANLCPNIVDLCAFTGITLTKIYNTAGIYTRAGSFSRSEEVAIYYYQGEKKTQYDGNDTCIGHLKKTSTVEENFGINCENVIDEIDKQMSILYASDDFLEIEKQRKNYFACYNLDKIEIYNKLDFILNKWFSGTKDQKILFNLVQQMVEKEANLEHVYSYIENRVKKSTKPNYKKELLEKKIKDEQITEKITIINYITNMLIDYIQIKHNMYQETDIRELYVTVNLRTTNNQKPVS